MRPAKTILLVLLLVVGSSAGIAQNRGGTFGFGFILGEPTGLAWKYKISHLNALDGVIGVSPGDRFRIHVDYLWNAYPFHDPNFSLHYGIGAVIGFGQTWFVEHGHGDGYWAGTTDLGFGVRVPFGIDYAIPRSPVELFFELAPIVIFTPGTGVAIDVGIGVRFYP
jgi:hypothetical protein